jgi:hypothetical protein
MTPSTPDDQSVSNTPQMATNTQQPDQTAQPTQQPVTVTPGQPSAQHRRPKCQYSLLKPEWFRTLFR